MTPGFTTGMRSSNTDQWATPWYLFDALDREFHFTLDVCADESNRKTARYYDRAIDGLSQPWEGVCWMNPPYGRTIGQWVRKAYESARGGSDGYGSRAIEESVPPVRHRADGMHQRHRYGGSEKKWHTATV